jgi:hypothetical protein
MQGSKRCRSAQHWVGFAWRNPSLRYAPGAPADEWIMLLKIIAFIAAAIPLIMFVRSMFFRRPTRLGTALKEFKKQIDFAIWIFLGLMGCVVVLALGRLLWTWWTSL